MGDENQPFLKGEEQSAEDTPSRHLRRVTKIITDEPHLLSKRFAGKHFVVIDDNRDIQQSFKVMMQLWGATVDTYITAEMATAALTAPDAKKPDLIIYDHKKPSLLQGNTIPAIQYTGRQSVFNETGEDKHNTPDAIHVNELQDHVVRKPDLPELIALISDQLSPRKSRGR